MIPAAFTDITRFVSFDTETHLIRPGVLAPPLVCGSFGAQVGSTRAGRLLSKEETRAVFPHLLKSAHLIIGANLPYDMLVCAVDAAGQGVDLMPLIFDKYDRDEMFDVQLAEALDAIAWGHLFKDPRRGNMPLRDPETGKQARYSLAVVTDLVLGRKNAKVNDEWRLRYAELDGVPIEEWPETARVYPVDDVLNPLEVALAQCGHWPKANGFTGPHRNLHDLPWQMRKHFALHLAAAWGLRTDRVATEQLAAAAQAGRDANRAHFVAAGFMRDDGTEDTAKVKTAVALAYGVDPFSACEFCVRGKRPSPKTGSPVNCPDCSATGLDLSTAPVPKTDPSAKFPKGQVQTGRDILIESGDELLMEYGDSQEDDKILDTYVPFLREGYDAPICLRPNPILETGRVSYSGVVQLLPRQVSHRLKAALRAAGSAVVGVRDCIVARPGWVFYSNDYSGGELVTFAESCVNRVGFSRMGEALIEGADVHALVAARMMGVEPGEAKKDPRFKAFRQAAKPANFGFPGGMGAVKMVLQQRKGGPDTPHPEGPSQVWDGKAFVPGYKGLRFCVITGKAHACGLEKVTSWGRAGWERPCPPTCRACIVAAEEIRAAWFAAWPEARPYLDWHAHNVDTLGEVTQHYSNRVRGGIDFCSAANGDFQALLADIAGRAQWRVTREQYVNHGTALFGSRSILFAHDELFGEAREEIAAEVSERVNEIMVEEFRKGCPHHAAACKAEPTLMRRWYKAAEPVRDAAGRLQPWEPK